MGPSKKFFYFKITDTVLFIHKQTSNPDTVFVVPWNKLKYTHRFSFTQFYTFLRNQGKESFPLYSRDTYFNFQDLIGPWLNIAINLICKFLQLNWLHLDEVISLASGYFILIIGCHFRILFQFTHDNVVAAENERMASIQLRTLIDNVLQDTSRDMMEQCDVVDTAFAKRVEEMEDAKAKMEENLRKVTRTLCS